MIPKIKARGAVEGRAYKIISAISSENRSIKRDLPKK
jgi:hypothetical protein